MKRRRWLHYIQPAKSTAICLMFLLAAYTLAAQTGCSCPPLNTCSACSGGLTYLKMEYTNSGIITSMVASDADGVLPSTFAGETITIDSRTPGQPFNGDVTIVVTKFNDNSDDVTVSASCASPLFVGDHIRNFQVVEGASVAGPICCADSKMDKVKPVLTGCPTDISVAATAGGCTVIVNWTPPTATDNCGNVILSSTHNPGATFTKGTTLVTYTATDDFNNTRTCSFNVIVTEASPPVISTCPANISVSTDASSCNALVSWVEPTASDCDLASFTSDIAPGSSFPIGVTTVTYTAKDVAANVVTCSFTVTVSDQIPPVFSNCPAAIQLDADQSCGVAVNWIAPTATDNCTSATVTSSHTPGSIFAAGTTLVTYTAMDADGNTATCSFSVTVADKIPPLFSGCPAPILLNTDQSCGTLANWIAPVATDNCTSVSVSSSHTPGSVFEIGTTTVTYVATDDAGNTATCSFLVTVTDKTPPLFSNCPTAIQLNADQSCGAFVNWIAPTATDNCTSISVTSSHTPGSVFAIGTTTVTYTAIDPAGNSSACSFSVTVTDNTSPVFSNCPATIHANVDASCSAVVSWTVPTATDNCSSVSITSSHTPGSTFPVGTTSVVYTATDAVGNTSQCQFDVVVSDFNASLTNCVSDIKAMADESGKAIVTWQEPGIVSVCGSLSLTSTYLSGSAFPIGTTQVTYTLVGSNATCQFSIVVEPIEVTFEVIQQVSPNGDGINDTWQLPNIEHFKNNKVILLDRWGGLVYEASGYNNESVVWNGSNTKGSGAPTGTYFYTITVEYESRKVHRTGFIELIR